MTPTLSDARKDNLVVTGLIFLVLSFLVFAFTVNVYNIEFDLFSGIFFINYAFTFIYFLLVFFNNKQVSNAYFKFSNFRHNILLVQLFNISAYSLNRSFTVFNISPNWVIGFLLLSNSLLVYHVLKRDYSNTWWNNLMLMVFNIGILFHFYESIYVFPGYIFGVLAFWFFGIPLHIFVPVLLMIQFVIVVRRFLKQSPKFLAPTLISWMLSLGLITYVTVRFHQVNHIVGQEFHASQQPYEDHHLPAWVEISKKLKKDWVTERALKTGIVYTDADGVFSGFNGGRLNERIKHDPLIVIASLFSNDIEISFQDRVKILNYMYDARHQTERKLWSGENLSTSDIITNVQLFPQYRLAYTEKTFKIHNSRIQRWGNQQEALYTFYLPEGSVVTSAALWVNGKEEPAYLTTKGKADSAYQAIVGRERRDPLLLHWKEGNRVTVRIFPCTPDEDRQFKIGVTTPLREKEDQLTYENIDFKGPYWKGAKESINVVTEGPLEGLSTPYSFRQEGTNYTYVGNYKSDWYLRFNAPPLAHEAFSFNGHSYQLTPYGRTSADFSPKRIYLDINTAWTKKEFNSIWKKVKDKKVFVYSNNRMQEVTEANRKALFKELKQQNFTLFPFYKMENTSDDLVISKFSQLTPTLSDLEKTAFLENISTFFNKDQQAVPLFNLSEEISPFLKTLKELRVIQLESGTLDDIVGLLEQSKFYANAENQNTIVNQYGGFKIEASAKDIQTSEAPDHLMRLFAYNNVLRQVGKNYFNKEDFENTWIAEAKEAYVVTPISSLIVLETQADYDRFDIKRSENSLQNASIEGSGAVPEPAEWLLIILVLASTLYLYYRK